MSGCTLISHKNYIDQLYCRVVDARQDEKTSQDKKSFAIREDVFDFHSNNQVENDTEKRRRRKINAKKYDIEITRNQNLHNLNQKIITKSKQFLDNCKRKNLFDESKTNTDKNATNSILLFKELCSDNVLEASLNGSNSSENAILTSISGQTYIIPPNCKFSNSYVSQIEHFANDLYDFVVIDPPWWNKFIRRVRGCKPEEGYNMMYNEDILKIPIEDLTHSNTLVAIWCTNSPTHADFLKNVALPKWNLKLLTTYYWVKITNSGDPVCEFNLPLRKQPYEHLFLAVHIKSEHVSQSKSDDDIQLIYSIPSVVHSHKPPLLEMFKDYLPTNPKCLEIFTRYLLPNFSSIGREVLKLQNIKLFHET